MAAKKPGKAIKMFDGEDGAFVAACSKADVKPTKRQYNKWLKGVGSARKASKE